MKKRNSITVAVLDLKFCRFSSDLVHRYVIFNSSITDDYQSSQYIIYNAGYTYVRTGKPHAQ